MASKTDARIPKPPKPPEKPLMPYMRYSRKVWEQVKNSNPHLKLWEVGKIIGSMWRELPDDEKALYVEEYDAEKSQYAELLRQYQSSPAYQAWLAAKERAEKNAEEQDQERKQSLLRSRERVADVQQTDLRESYMLEDNEEDPEDQYTVKHVAAARFQRNHRLMQEVLSETRLPELGQLITQSRMNTLHLQVEQLTTHKRNMCLEIESCENRHRNKISRMKEESENFLKDYRRLTAARPMITENQFAEMIVRAKQNMIREEEERLSRIAAEAEARRKRQQRQQQQREMDMAAAAEAERRRQMQQPARMIHSGADHGDRSANILIQDAKMDPTFQRSNVQGVPTSAPEIETPSTGSTTVAYSNGPTSVGVVQTVSAASGQKFVGGGHTQHHYPPPQSVYTPSPVPSHVPLIQRLQSPGAPVPQPAINNPVSTKVNMTQNKKPSSSASSTSSGSSVSSSTSSTKKRKSDAGISKDKKSLNDFITAEARGPGTVDITSEQQPKGTDIAMVSGSPGDYPPPTSAIQRQHPTTPQQYVQTARPPTAMIVPGNLMPGMPVATAHQGTFAYDGSGVSMPPGTYYQQHMSGMPQSASHQNYQLRPAFGQHMSYNNMQYQPHPHSVDHSSVMYVHQQQPPHMPPQPQMSQPHIHQPAAPPMMGQPQQHPTPPPPQGGHPHSGGHMGWHQPGPGYPNQFGPPPPRGCANQPPVVYTPQSGGPPISHGARMSAGYVIPQHGCTPESGAVTVSGIQTQSIPAPPPYQHQQVQQPPGGGIHPGYWSAVPQSHQMPVEYAPGPQQPAPSPHHYMPVPQHPQEQVEAVGGGGPQPSQMVPMAPTSSVGPSSTNVDGVPGHMHADAGQAHIGPHHTGVYYQGYGPSNMTSGGVAPQQSSYYGMQTEQQHPGSGPVVSGHYPHNSSVQQMPQAGAWPGHYSSMPRTPHQSYPHGQPPPPSAQPNHAKVPDPSNEQTSTPGAPVASGPPSRPHSVSSNSAAPPPT